MNTQASPRKSEYSFSKYKDVHEVLLLTLDSIVSHLDDRITRVGLFSKTKKGLRTLQTVRKKIKEFQKQYLGMLLAVRHVKRQKSSGLNAPRPIPKELADFLGLDPAASHSRIDITRAFSKYIASHHLQNPEMRTRIVPDSRMRALFEEEFTEDSFTYTELQKILSQYLARKKTESDPRNE